MKICARGRVLSVALLTGVAWPGVLLAQDMSPAPVARAAAQTNATAAASNAAATAPGDNANPADIVVTALRGQQKLENVPASVIAVSGTALKTAGVVKFQDLAIIAPGVQIARAGSYTQPAIRGISTTFAGGGQETNVAIYVDGFYTSDQLSSNQDFANIQDVEVLKGPQGTLYGRNATGGAILITTRSPTDHLQGETSASYAPRFDDKQFSAFIGGPIANGIKFSIAAYYHDSDGYAKDINHFSPNVVLRGATYDFGGHGFFPIQESSILKRKGDDAGPYKNWSVRPKLVIDGIDNLKVTLGYVHTFVNDPRAFDYQIVGQAANLATVYNGYPVANARDRVSLNFQPVNQSVGNEYNGTVELSLGDLGKLTSRSAYRTQSDVQVYDLDGTPANSNSRVPNVPAAVGTTYIGIQYNKRKTFTQQLDYNADFGRLNVLAGLFYYDDKFKTPEGVEDIGTASNPTVTRLILDTKAYAGYLQATYNLNDKLFITVGGRYSHDQKKLGRERYSQNGLFVPAESSICYSDTTNPVYLSPGAASALLPPVACTGSFYKRVKKSSFTPQGVIRYNLSRGTNVYASISRGFKAPTINTASPFNSVKQETVTAYEAGFKTARNGFRAELSGFYYNYKDNQISANDPNTPTITTRIQNSGGAHVYGLDATTSYHVPDSQLNLRAGFEYLHARYTNFPNASDTIVSPVSGLNTSVVGSWTGRRLVRAPDFSGSAGADYTLDLFGGKLVTSGTLTFSSRYAPQNASYQCTSVVLAGLPSCDPATTNSKTAKGRFEENGYVLGNVQVAWTDPSDHYTVTVYSDNVSNTRYKIVSSAFFYESYDQYNEPRTVGMRLGAKF